MKRNCSLSEISDGKLYTSNDLVEASCNGCKGLASCCHGMGNTIGLDPYDIYRLTTMLDLSFDELLMEKLELNLVDGIILPNLKMTGSTEGCAFLNEKGRCSIHSLRPGICRIFPLGRYYENQEFKYFLQKQECKNSSVTRIKVSKWIDTPELEKNEKFLIKWHYFLNAAEQVVKAAKNASEVKDLNIYILNTFYRKKYDKDLDFYFQFNKRLLEAKRTVKI